MNKKLSPTMLEVIEYMKQHDDVILRHPGGFWGAGALKFPTWGASSVHALVLRDVAEYSEWAEGRNGRFPIAAKLKRAESTEPASQPHSAWYHGLRGFDCHTCGSHCKTIEATKEIERDCTRCAKGKTGRAE